MLRSETLLPKLRCWFKTLDACVHSRVHKTTLTDFSVSETGHNRKVHYH